MATGRRLLTGNQVAEILRIRPQSLRIRRMRGQGPPFIRLDDSPTARAFYPEKEFYEWLEARPLITCTLDERKTRKYPRRTRPRRHPRA